MAEQKISKLVKPHKRMAMGNKSAAPIKKK